jgi:hypothetical protein
MEYQDFINTLPSNNLNRFDDINLFLETYSFLYPTEPEREQIYRLEAEIFSYHCLFYRPP